jgi:GNAT superfamily N-acetyltransferase
MDNPVIRAAVEADVPVVLALIRELAEYEKLSHEAVATEHLLRESLFGPRPAAWVLLAEQKGEPVGFALYFETFSTFLAQRGIYLEDLYVRPHARSRGVGRQLLLRVAREAAARGGRLEWSVLNWNEGAIRFYQSLGAWPMDEWTVYRLAGEALNRFAAAGDKACRDQTP